MEFIKQLAFRGGFTVGQQVPASKVSDVFQKLRPMDAGIPLIRVGGGGDGGYLLPDDLEGIEACFSPGVDITATFESDMLARGIPCFQADASVEQSPLQGARGVDFERKYLGIVNDDLYTTLDTWIDRKVPGTMGDLVLQMDIEGAEWLVLAAAHEATLARFRIIAIEFHGLHRAVDRFDHMMIAEVIRKLSRQFVVVHAHPNNWSPMVRARGFQIAPLMEYTFIRRDRVQRELTPIKHFPHALDRDNIPHRPSFALSQSMYDHPSWN